MACVLMNAYITRKEGIDDAGSMPSDQLLSDELSSPKPSSPGCLHARCEKGASTGR
jgi:hypothetical protein